MTLLSSERLFLREFTEQDMESVHAYAVDPEVVKYMPWGPNTENDTREFLRRAISLQHENPRTHFDLAIILKNQGRLIGGCSIRMLNLELREGNIGYCLNREYWDKGYATEAARTLIVFGFNELNFHRIFATCDPENYASIKVLQKIGMTLEGQLRENLKMRGEWRDTQIYAILDHEWKTQMFHMARTLSTQ